VKSKTGLNARRVPSPVLGHRLVAPGSEKGNRSCSPEGGRLPGQTSAPPSPQLPSRTVGAACRLRVHSPRGQKEKAAQVTRTCSEGEDALHKLHGSASLIKDALESKQKLQKYAKSCFQASDANGDGQVSFEELCKCMQKMNADLGIGDFTERHVMHYLQRFDTDGDELLNEKEFQELYRALLLVKLEEVEPADFSRDMFIGRRKGKPEDNYEVFGIVGVGSFGVVRKVKCKLTGTTRVMKVVDKQKALNGGYPLKLIMEEIDKLRALDHPSVLRLFEYCADALNLYLFTDMLPGGDLLDIVEGSYNKKRRIEENWVRDVFRQAAEGVAYCHAKGVMHKDLKLENIMLASVQPPEAVVIDVGLAELFPPSEADSFSSADPAGTLATMAPEVIRGNFNAKCDVWSLGCCLYALLCRKPLRLEDVKGEGKGEVELYDYFYPFSPPPDESRPELKAYIARQKEGPDFTRLECSEDVRSLLTLLLTYDKEPRPSMQKVLGHQWLELSRTSSRFSKHQLESLLQFHRINPLAQAVLLDLASQLPLKQLREMSSLFESMDKDGNGMLDQAELAEGLRLGGLAPAAAADTAERLAKGAGGCVEFSRFVAALAPSCQELIDDEHLRSSFNRLDANGDGYVSRCELQRLLERGSKASSTPEDKVDANRREKAARSAQKAFDAISGEGRQRVSFESFRRHLGSFVA